MGLFGGSNHRALLDEASAAAHFIGSGTGASEAELEVAAVIAVAWGKSQAAAAVPFIVAGMEVFHRLAPAQTDFSEKGAPQGAINRVNSRSAWMRKCGLDAPSHRNLLLAAEAAVDWSDKLLGAEDHRRHLDARRVSINKAKRAGLPHPGPFVTVEHLWDLGFGTSLMFQRKATPASRANRAAKSQTSSTSRPEPTSTIRCRKCGEAASRGVERCGSCARRFAYRCGACRKISVGAGVERCSGCNKRFAHAPT